MADTLDYLQNIASSQEVEREVSNENEAVENQATEENVTTENNEVVEEVVEETTIIEPNTLNTPTVENSVVDEKKPLVNEKISELNDFLERNPELSPEDYFELKKPISSIPEETLIEKYLSEKEGLTPSALKLRMKKLEVANNIDLDEDFDEESTEVLEARAEKERLLKLAQEFHSEKVEGLLKPTVNNNVENIETTAPTEEEIKLFQQEVKQKYNAKIMQASNEFDGVEIEVNGEKITIIPTDEDRVAVRETGLNLNEVTSKYFSQDGLELEKSSEFAKEILFWQTEATRNAALKSVFEQGVEYGKLQQMKNHRNINNSANIEIGNFDAGVESMKNQLYAVNRVSR